MQGNLLVPFLEGLEAVMPPGHSARGRWQHRLLTRLTKKGHETIMVPRWYPTSFGGGHTQTYGGNTARRRVPTLRYFGDLPLSGRRVGRRSLLQGIFASTSEHLGSDSRTSYRYCSQERGDCTEPLQSPEDSGRGQCREAC